MFFRDEDPVSVYTLADAAARVLADISANGNTGPGSHSDLVHEDGKESVQELLSESKNFFAQGRGELDPPQEFKPVFNHVSLLDAVSKYSAIKKAYSPETFIFLVWYSREYPSHLKQDSSYAGTLEVINRTLPDQRDKQSWYNFIRLLRGGRLSDNNITLTYGL